MRVSTKRILCIFTTALFFGLGCFGQVTVNQAVRQDTSRPLSEMVAAAPAQAVQSVPYEIPLGELPQQPSSGVQADTAVQASISPNVATTPGLNFDGIPVDPARRVAPPDTNGAAGLTQYVQIVNLRFAVFDKTSGVILLGPANNNTLWAGFGGDCETHNNGDPIVNYDRIANRWVISQFAINFNTGPFSQCVAVSTTSSATGSYNRYQFVYPTQFIDYPKVGVWPDAYYVSYNVFTATGSAFLGAKACAFDRAKMIAGIPATQVCFQLSPSFGGLLPSDLDGATLPPAGEPNFFMSFGTNQLNLWKFHVDFATPALSTFTGPTIIPVAPFTRLCSGFFRGQCVPQPAPGTTLESLGDRLMYRLAYRNFGTHESLVVNHSISTGVRWYEVRSPNGAVSVYQSGTYAPDSTTRWMGSIAMDQSGDIALGYSASSLTLFPSIRYTGRVPGDPLGTMQSETTIFTGLGAQTLPLHRWGDYSAMQIDPVDDCTFWYTTEYLPATGNFNWNTRIASFKFPTCCPPPAISNVSATPNVLWPPDHKFVNVTINYTVTSNCPSTCTLSVTSNEPPNNKEPDWIVVDAHHVQLRAERDGDGTGRIYTVTITCTNAGGTTTKTVTVAVPHDQSQ